MGPFFPKVFKAALVFAFLIVGFTIVDVSSSSATESRKVTESTEQKER